MKRVIYVETENNPVPAPNVRYCRNCAHQDIRLTDNEQKAYAKFGSMAWKDNEGNLVWDCTDRRRMICSLNGAWVDSISRCPRYRSDPKRWVSKLIESKQRKNRIDQR